MNWDLFSSVIVLGPEPCTSLPPLSLSQTSRPASQWKLVQS